MTPLTKCFIATQVTPSSTFRYRYKMMTLPWLQLLNHLNLYKLSLRPPRRQYLNLLSTSITEAVVSLS